MKRSFADLRTIFVVVLGFVLMGCSRGSSSSGAANTLTADFFTGAISGGITVSAYDSMASRNFLEEAGRAFEALNPGVKVNVETFSAMPEIREMDQGNTRAVMVQMQDDPQSRADYISRVNTNIMSGTGADLYAIDIVPLHKFSASGTLENLEPYMEIDPGFNKADYKRNIIDALRYNNGTWFLPLDYTFNYFAYDSTLVPAETAQNFGPTKAWTAEALFETALPLYDGTNKIFNTMDYDRRGGGGMFAALLSENILSFVNFETKRANFTDGGFTRLLESVKNFGEEGLIPRGVTAQQNAGQIMQMAASAPVDRFFFKMNSNFSVFTQFSRSTGRINRVMNMGAAQGIEDDDEIAGIEAIVGGLVPFKYNQGYGINAQSKNKAAAWAFLKFLLSDEVQVSTNLNPMGLPLNNRARAEKAELSFTGANMSIGGGAVLTLNDQQRTALEGYKAAVETLSGSINTFVVQDTSLNDMIASEVQYFFEGSRTADEVARVLQNKVDLYLNE